MIAPDDQTSLYGFYIGEDPNTLHEIHSEVTYDDILRRNGASVKYMRRFNNEKEKITLNNRSFEAKSKV